MPLDNRLKHLALALLALLVILVAWDFLFWSGRFPPNCYIESVDVSGLSKFEAMQKLRSVNADDVVLDRIKIIVDNEVISYKPSEIGVFISPRKTIINSTDIFYRRNYLVDLSRRMLGGYRKRVIPLSLYLDKKTYQAILEGMANDYDVPSKEATFRLYDDGHYVITREKVGRKIDVAASVKALDSALKVDERSADVNVILLKPRVYANPLIKYPPKYLLAEYTTYYGSHDSPNRVHNIKVGTNRLNNHVISSGETFSLLEKMGTFSLQRGFREAFVIYNGQLEPQYGGGSCQIASTLYNAALLADLEITERHNHGIYFTIYPLGRDASIYSGSMDLKFVNNTRHPICIKGTAEDKKIVFRIYGTPTAKKVTFSRPMVLFEGEKFKPYDVSSEEAKNKINEALLSGRSFATFVKVRISEAGYTKEKFIRSSYKMTGDKENVKIVRPEPE